MNILVTGSAGMIGSYVVKGLIEKGHTVIGVDRVKPKEELDGLKPVVLDLASKEDLMKLFDENKIDRAIHLAALAHTVGVKDTSWEAFKKVNVDCAENVFDACSKLNIPILFISTVDAIGMVKGVITPNTELNPTSNYGKSKALAESRLKEICNVWNIYRFSPVYTPDVKRDIEKRYYLKYPNWAYKIGKGGMFEVLNITGAIASMVDWVGITVDNTTYVIKDQELLDVNDLIMAEKAQGRAMHVLWFPRWMVVCGYYVIRLALGKSNKTYLLFKALWPFRTSDEISIKQA
jgi:nucleoside-diphosphate-sugar epimerase